jgi:hypothetical protein
MATINKTPPNNQNVVRNARSPKVFLDITPELIAKSTKKDSSHCMIAEAVKEAFPGARFVSVDLQTIRFTDPDPKRPYRYTYLTPRRAQVALVDFDQGREIDPFKILIRGGAVTPIRTKNRKPKPVAPPVKPTKATKNGKTESESGYKVAARKTLLPPRTGTNKHNVPEVSGGQTPPRAALSSPKRPKGTRRAYGLRSMSA